MNTFYIDKTINKIWEHVNMPNLLNFDYDKFLEELKDDHEAVVSLQSLKLLQDICEALKVHKQLIDDFYIEGEFSFFHLLNFNYPLDSKKDQTLLTYLNRISEQDDQEILISIFYGVLFKEQFPKRDEGLLEQAKQMVQDFNVLMQWLNKSSYSKEAKWRLLQITQNPKLELSRFRELVNLIQPIFDKYFEAFEPSIELDLENLLQQMQDNGPEPLGTLTDGLLEDSILPNGPTLLCISYFQPFQITINLTSLAPQIIWGQYVEAFLAYQKRLKEDAINDHIRLFKNLGDRTRFQVAHLVSKGINSTKEIAESLGVTPATISYHLNQLVNARIVKLDTVDGKLQYIVNHKALKASIDAVMELLGIS